MTVVVTFDIDWAPDWTVRLCLDLCRAAKVPATFYATHQSPVLDDLRSDGHVEVGIHPNFLHGSTHGSSIRSALAHCLELVPNAKSMRTHGLYQSTQMFAEVMDQCPSIIADASLFMPDHSDLRPTLLHLAGRRPLVRLPYWWEDDIAACTPGFDWSPSSRVGGGLQIYDFHPIHVALNMRRLDQYHQLKQALIGPLWEATDRDLAPFVNEAEKGARTFLEALLGTAGVTPFATIESVAAAFLRAGQEEACG